MGQINFVFLRVIRKLSVGGIQQTSFKLVQKPYNMFKNTLSFIRILFYRSRVNILIFCQFQVDNILVFQIKASDICVFKCMYLTSGRFYSNFGASLQTIKPNIIQITSCRNVKEEKKRKKKGGKRPHYLLSRSIG